MNNMCWLAQGLIRDTSWMSLITFGLSTIQTPCNAGCTWTPVKLRMTHRTYTRYAPRVTYLLLLTSVMRQRHTATCVRPGCFTREYDSIRAAKKNSPAKC